MPLFEYDRSKGTFRAYLRTITQRKVVDHLRRSARRPEHSFDHASGKNGHRSLADPVSPSAEQAWELEWRRNLLQLCLDRVRHEVNPKTFQAFHLYCLEEWPVAEVAEFLKMSIASVYTAKSRVAQRIKYWMEKEIGEDE